MNPMRAPLARLSEIAVSITDGDHQAPPKAPSGVPFLTIAAINNSYLAIDRATRYVPEAYFAALRPDRKPQIGDVLFSVTGSIAIPAIVDDPRPFTFQRHIAIIRPDAELVDTRYLWHGLQTTDIKEQARSVATGTAQPTIPLGGLRNFEVPLPPLPEQRRIAAKLDSLTDKFRRGRDHLDHIPRLVEKYKQALLTATFTRVSADALHRKLGDIAEFVTSGSRGWAKYYSESGPLFIRVANVSRGRIGLSFSDTQHVTPPNGAEGERTRVQSRDILITITADLGRVGLVPAELGTAYVNQHVALVRLHQPEHGNFLAWYLTSELGQRQMLERDRGMTRAGLGLDDIRRVILPIPSIDEQRETVHRLETAFAWIDRLASEATSARRLIDWLDQAVLAKAFRGELVPQDPADEPASSLLARIRSEQKSNSKPKRSRKAVA